MTDILNILTVLTIILLCIIVVAWIIRGYSYIKKEMNKTSCLDIGDLKPCKFEFMPEKQLEKISDEMYELKEVINDVTSTDENRKFHAGEECADIITACQTLLKHHYSDREISNIVNYVNAKNECRGYIE